MSPGQASDLLEPDVVKVTSPVLRGAGGSNAAPPTRLPEAEPTAWCSGGRSLASLRKKLARAVALAGAARAAVAGTRSAQGSRNRRWLF
jgi:hypothetical protein